MENLKRNILVTGGSGFIGSNFILYWLKKYPNDHIYNLDALTYAGNPDNLISVASSNHYTFVHGNIEELTLLDLLKDEGIQYVVHFAAESHVDRSILDPFTFIQTNIAGTGCLLQIARQLRIKKFVHISTDEVYGSLGETGYFTESSPLMPNSPYAASKASSDMLVRSYHQTYGLPTLITRCSNNYGPRQFPEKLIPTIITKAMSDEAIPIYGDGKQIRDWLHVEDHCKAIDAVFHQGMPGEVYNIGGNNEYTNLELASRILAELGKPLSLIQFTEDRLGHDRRYAIDSGKIKRTLGWFPAFSPDQGIKNTIAWYLTNQDWLERIQSGAYRTAKAAAKRALEGAE